MADRVDRSTVATPQFIQRLQGESSLLKGRTGVHVQSTNDILQLVRLLHFEHLGCCILDLEWFILVSLSQNGGYPKNCILSRVRITIKPCFSWVPNSQPSPNGCSAMAPMLPWQSRQKLHFPWQQRSNGGEATHRVLGSSCGADGVGNSSESDINIQYPIHQYSSIFINSHQYSSMSISINKHQ